MKVLFSVAITLVLVSSSPAQTPSGGNLRIPHMAPSAGGPSIRRRTRPVRAFRRDRLEC
jgi:hypothetical protein